MSSQCGTSCPDSAGRERETRAMWIRDIDLPQALLDAAEAGRLVIFVGAGASRDKPSGLPDFHELVRNIGTLAGNPPSETDLRQPDAFLGSLEDLSVDVHRLVADAIDHPGSVPNRLHKALVSLATAYPSPRIVTTNYDLHLTIAASEGGFALDVFEAPALPVGDDFEGIVHLHGALTQEPRRLVVTDSDFGRAYLRDAWAARFLERMFARFTVLFVGYSHGDIVMQYLARSLGSATTRFVLTDIGDSADWRRLGLTAIPYVSANGDHSSLPAAIERWVEIASMGQTEHRARVTELLSAEPPTIPEEVSYLEATLMDPARVRYFAEKAQFTNLDRGHRWFRWVSSLPVFQELFGRETAATHTSGALISWVADQYVSVEANSAIALRIFRDRPWSPETWSTIAQRLFARASDTPAWLAPWLILVLQNAPSARSDYLDYLLARTEWCGNFDLAILVLENRTQPFVKSAFDMGNDSEQPRFDVDLCGDEYSLREAWTRVFAPALTDHLEAILGVVEQQLTRACQCIRALDHKSTFDPVSFGRSAIEPHPQDSHRDAMDVLIDAIRDCIEAALADTSDIADRHLETWLSSPDAIFQRLAIHAWRVRSDKSASEKLVWLHDQNLLWTIPLQHEVFQLLKDCVPAVSESEVRWVVDTAVTGPPAEGDAELAAYRSYNLLAWLVAIAPHTSSANEAFGAAQHAHPEWKVREHPDLNRTMSFGTVENAMPLSVDELHALVEANPSQALDRLRDFQQNGFALGGPTWAGALESVLACVAAHPNDGILLAQALLSNDIDIQASIIRGWDRANLDPELAEQAITVIDGWQPEDIRKEASTMLSNGGSAEHPTPWHKFDSAQLLAARLWPTSPTTGAIISGGDIVMEAINQPAGDLAEYWTKVVQWKWSEQQTTWTGIPLELKAQLDILVNTSDRNGLLARTILCSQLHFFFAADRDWTQTRLLPLFSWGEDEINAMAAWHGFLTWGRLNDGLVEAGLLEDYIGMAKRSEDLPSDLQHQLASHLALIVLHGASEPAALLSRFVIEAAETLRVGWAKEIQRALLELDEPESTHQWSRWIEAYWSGRNRSTPRPFTRAEASATGGWVLGLPTVRSRAVDLVLASEANLEASNGFLFGLEEADIAAEATDWARLLTHLLRNTTRQQTTIGYHLRGIISRLRSATPPPDISQLIDEALRLGITEAPNW